MLSELFITSTHRIFIFGKVLLDLFRHSSLVRNLNSSLDSSEIPDYLPDQAYHIFTTMRPDILYNIPIKE